MHNPKGKKIVLGVRRKPNGSYAAAANFLTKPVAAEFPVFLNSDKIPSVPLDYKVPANNGLVDILTNNAHLNKSRF